MSEQIFASKASRGSQLRIYPVGNTEVGPGANEWSIKNDAGLYVRSDVDYGVIEEKLLYSTPDVTLDEWQLWGQNNWKPRHGTKDAAMRFGRKLVSEYQEYIHEYINVASLQDSPDRLDEERKLVSEAGDVFWCAASGASNAGGRLESALRLHIYKTAAETSGSTLGQHENASPFVVHLAELALSDVKPVTLGDIDALLDLGFVPASINKKFDTSSHRQVLVDADSNLHKRSFERVDAQFALQIQQYGVEDIIAHNHRGGYESYEMHSDRIAELAIGTMIDIAYKSYALAGAHFSTIIRANYKKLSGRVENNLIDREDGVRPEHLL